MPPHKSRRSRQSRKSRRSRLTKKSKTTKMKTKSRRGLSRSRSRLSGGCWLSDLFKSKNTEVPLNSHLGTVNYKLPPVSRKKSNNKYDYYGL